MFGTWVCYILLDITLWESTGGFRPYQANILVIVWLESPVDGQIASRWMNVSHRSFYVIEPPSAVHNLQQVTSIRGTGRLRHDHTVVSGSAFTA